MLDPFCGTGSLLISAAFLGARVVGSDTDADCLGLVDHDRENASRRSKNANFRRRKKGDDEEWSQSNFSTRSNFEYYNLSSNIEALVNCSVEHWAQVSSPSDSKINCFDLFDAVRFPLFIPFVICLHIFHRS